MARWIVRLDKDISGDEKQMLARREFIRRVTNTQVSDWYWAPGSKEFVCCTSEDEIDGVFITAHVGDVHEICRLREVYMRELVIVNSCIWERLSHKRLLHSMMQYNRKIELWFAKQELSVDGRNIFRQTTTLLDVGVFGFKTSLSERELFTNRNKGLREAISKSFVRVSPIILLGD